MPRNEDTADAYKEATDSSRHLLRVRSNDRQEHRIKPDLETHPEAEFDFEGSSAIKQITPPR
jgi:hypothetical protein